MKFGAGPSRFDHAYEAISPVETKRAPKAAARAEALQQLLGDNQDRVIARQWLADAAADHPQASFVAGELAGLLRSEQTRDPVQGTRRDEENVQKTPLDIEKRAYVSRFVHQRYQSCPAPAPKNPMIQSAGPSSATIRITRTANAMTNRAITASSATEASLHGRRGNLPRTYRIKPPLRVKWPV